MSNRDSSVLPPPDSPPASSPPLPSTPPRSLHNSNSNHSFNPHGNPNMAMAYPPSPGPHTPTFDTPLLSSPPPGTPLSPPTPNFSRPHQLTRTSSNGTNTNTNSFVSYADSPRNSDFLPPGANMGGMEQPRFIGAAAMSGNPGVHGFNRESYASMGGSDAGHGYGGSLASRGQTPIYPSGAGTDSRNNSSYALNEGQTLGSGAPYGSAAGAGATMGYRDDPHASSTPDAGYIGNEKAGLYGEEKKKGGRKKVLLIILGVVILAVVGAVVAVYFTVIKPKSSTSGDSSEDDSNSSGGHNGSHNGGSTLAKSGGDGSTVTMDDGSTFIYNNTFGGKWYWDPKDPLNNAAQAQADVAPLKEGWRWGVDRIRGVNLGGWLNTEPFIVPALYEKYSPMPVDEWTLSQAMAADTAGGGLNQMEDHYKTFITEKDFAEIAGAGLNWVRIPIGWWAIEVREGEPFLPKVSWTYFLKAIQWARKYGLRINLDLHAVPGSQNGWNHSGRLGEVNFLRGPMGYANAQRALDYVRILAEFVSQPQYSDVVAMFGVLNEPKNDQTGSEQMLAFYYEAYKIIRSITGEGKNTGPMISYHDAFLPRSSFVDWLPNADRISLDNHPYLCFGDQSASPYSSYSNTPCTTWSANFQSIMSGFGLIVAGEWSNAVTDCGLFVNGVGLGTRYEGDYKFGSWPKMGSCKEWTDYQSWDAAKKKDIKQFAMASMDALGNAFFWTWRIGESLASGKVESPQWSYKLGLEEGWMPTDPRSSDGLCSNGSPADVALKSWQTGGAGAGQIPDSNKAAMVWPPASIMNAGPPASLQTYTPTGTLVKLPAPTFSDAGKDVNVGDGWMDDADTAGMAVMPSGCAYVDPWIGSTGVVTPCGGAAAGGAGTDTTTTTTGGDPGAVGGDVAGGDVGATTPEPTAAPVDAPIR